MKNFWTFFCHFSVEIEKNIYLTIDIAHTLSKLKFVRFQFDSLVEKSPFGKIFKNLNTFQDDCMAHIWIVFNFSNVSIFMYSNNIFHRVLCSIDVFWGVLWGRVTLRQWYKQFKQKKTFFFKCVPCNVHILSGKYKTTSNWF